MDWCAGGEGGERAAHLLPEAGRFRFQPEFQFAAAWLPLSLPMSTTL